MREKMRRGQSAQDRVYPVGLVVRDQPHRLLAHCTLVRVARRLVVVRVRDEPRAHAEDRERVDLHVRVLRLGRELPLVDRNVPAMSGGTGGEEPNVRGEGVRSPLI